MGNYLHCFICGKLRKDMPAPDGMTDENGIAVCVECMETKGIDYCADFIAKAFCKHGFVGNT